MTNIVKFPTARPSSDDDLEGLFWTGATPAGQFLLPAVSGKQGKSIQYVLENPVPYPTNAFRPKWSEVIPMAFDRSLIAVLISAFLGMASSTALAGQEPSNALSARRAVALSYRRILVTEWVRRQRLELAI
jgi:hypothetical protein